MTRRGPVGAHWPILLTLMLIAGALAPEPELRDAVTHEPVDGDPVLERPAAYVALAPICAVLDAVTLLGFRQHYAFASTIMALFVVAGLGRSSAPRWSVRALRGALAGTFALVVVYAAATLVPRPIAGLAVSDPDVVVVDFHSHTGASADVRDRFTAEANRAWHRAGGYHAAYVTDHDAFFDGVRAGLRGNPRRAGDDTVLLPGTETRANGLQLLVLGLSERGMAVLETDRAKEGTPLRREHDFVVALTIPGSLELTGRLARTRVGNPVAIEVADGGTKGLQQRQRDHEEIVSIARRRDLAPISGTNTHGWGSTANAWTLLRLPGWRALAPEALGERIEHALRTERFRATRVVERWAVESVAAPFGDVAIVPLIAWRVLATLTPLERCSWLVWIWGLALVAPTTACRRAAGPSPRR